jgi:hypothetical protein
MVLSVGLALAASFGQDLSQLAFMAGCWQGSGGTEEQWMKPAGGTMFGMSRTVVNGKTVFWEYLRVVAQDGGWAMVVLHSRNPQAVTFRATRISSGEAIFENPEHDFPQRILYRKQPDGSLFARIEGKEKGKERGVDFPMTRARCEGPPS